MVVNYAPDGRRLWSGFLENGSSTGNVSFLKPVTAKYDAAGTPIWGDLQRR